MSFLRDLLDDVEAATKIGTWRAKRVATVLGLALVVGYLLAASGHLGDMTRNALATRGLSIFEGVHVEVLAQEEDPYQFEGGGHEDDELRVLLSGKVAPCTGATTVVAALYRTDRPNDPRPSGWTQWLATDGDCRWRAPAPFFISELGEYEVEARVHRAGHDIGSTTESLKRIHPTGVEQSAPFPERPATQHFAKDRARVSVVYLDEPNFNRRVFERALLELNRRMQSFEVQVLDVKTAGCAKGPTSQAKDCFAALAAVAAAAKASRDPETGLLFGIVSNTLESDDTSGLYTMIDDSNRFQVASSEQSLFFNGRSSPSIYKYLLTAIVAGGATIARDPKVDIRYHRAVRGCIFDYDEEKIRAQIGVEIGYLCTAHRKQLEAARLGPEAMRDLTEGLPLSWLK